jgi:hypothetical protein
MFIEALDAAIQKVHRDLVAAGLPDEEIWIAFRSATQAICTVCNEIEIESPIRDKVQVTMLKPGLRRKHLV